MGEPSKNITVCSKKIVVTHVRSSTGSQDNRKLTKAVSYYQKSLNFDNEGGGAMQNSTNIQYLVSLFIQSYNILINTPYSAS